MPSRTTRREFLQQSTLGAAAVAAALGPVHVSGIEKPASVRLGIIGCGGIMTHHVKGLVSRRESVSIAWLCDVDSASDRQNGLACQSRFPAGRPEANGTVRRRHHRQGRRCGDHRHATPLACTDRAACHAGRQRRLHREADLARLRRRAA